MDHSLSQSGGNGSLPQRGWIISALVMGLATVTSVALLWSVGRGHSEESVTIKVPVNAPKSATTAAPVIIQESLEPMQHPSAPAIEVPVPVPVVPEPEVLPAVSDRSTRLLGFWKLDDGICRRIEVRPDGTATMEVKLDAISALFYGPKLTLEVSWKLEGNVLTYIAVSGKPEDKVARLLKDFGSTQVYTIIEFEDDHVLLELNSDQTRQNWQREQS